MVDADNGTDADSGAEAPGWDAIDGALSRLYPGREPLHFGTMHPWSLGGPDPLDGISFYPNDGHWHVVSYGMSELYEKESEDAEESGWGYEFTFRPARAADETEPPIWAANVLQNLARYVFSSLTSFSVGHRIDLNGPIALHRPDTVIRAATFVEDPELGTIATPHGQLRFLQLVGLSLDEHALAQRGNSAGLIEALAPHLPLLVTDLDRPNLAADPGVLATFEEGLRRHQR